MKEDDLENESTKVSVQISEELIDINNIVKLYKNEIMNAEQAIGMIESVLKKIEGGLE